MVIESVIPVRFASWVRTRPFQVLFLGSGVVRRPAAVVENLGMHFPGQVGAGWMDAEAVPEPEWWSRHFVTELGPYRHGAVPPLGVYLFHLGFVVGHHPGTAHAGGSEVWAAVREYLIERIRLKIAARRAVEDDSTAGSSRVVPPPSALVRPDDPYLLLEVSPEASDEELKRAFRRALKLNHPDRVAHLSKAIQRFAHEETQRILAAWQRIKDERGLR